MGTQGLLNWDRKRGWYSKSRQMSGASKRKIDTRSVSVARVKQVSLWRARADLAGPPRSSSSSRRKVTRVKPEDRCAFIMRRCRCSRHGLSGLTTSDRSAEGYPGPRPRRGGDAQRGSTVHRDGAVGGTRVDLHMLDSLAMTMSERSVELPARRGQRRRPECQTHHFSVTDGQFLAYWGGTPNLRC